MANQSREKKKEQEANETDTDADKAVKLKRWRHSILSKKKAFSFVKCLARRIPAGCAILVPPDKLAAWSTATRDGCSLRHHTNRLLTRPAPGGMKSQHYPVWSQTQLSSVLATASRCLPRIELMQTLRDDGMSRRQAQEYDWMLRAVRLRRA